MLQAQKCYGNSEDVKVLVRVTTRSIAKTDV